MSLKLCYLDKSEDAVLGHRMDEYQKAFFGLLGGEAIHIDFDRKIASYCMWARGLFQWRLDTTDGGHRRVALRTLIPKVYAQFAHCAQSVPMTHFVRPFFFGSLHLVHTFRGAQNTLCKLFWGRWELLAHFSWPGSHFAHTFQGDAQGGICAC